LASNATDSKVHFQVSLMALISAKLEARQNAHEQLTSFSIASLKRRSIYQHFIDRILTTFQGTTLDKSSPAYESLCDDGSMTDLIA
jgi:hypothetical protein